MLQSFVETERRRAQERERQLDALIVASNAFIARHGAFGDDFSTL